MNVDRESEMYEMMRQHDARTSVDVESEQCNDCAAIEGGPIEGCDYCNITVPYNGRYYTQKSMMNDEHTCSACSKVVAYEDIVGDGTNRGLCCVSQNDD